jgi:hypothetical protein
MIIVAVAMAPLSALAAWAAAEERALAEDRERINAQRWVRLVDDRHQLLVRDARQLLRVLAQVPVVRDGEADACHLLFAELLARYPRYVTFGLARADGQLIASADRKRAAAWLGGDRLVSRLFGQAMEVEAANETPSRPA